MTEIGFAHDALVWFSKSYGLVYLIVLSIGVLIYTFWPKNREKFREAARRPIEDEEDRPWQ